MCIRDRTRSLRAFGIYNLVLSMGIDILPIIIHIVSEVSYCSLHRDRRLLGAAALAGTAFQVDRYALADELVRRNVPFQETHQLVGQADGLATGSGKSLQVVHERPPPANRIVEDFIAPLDQAGDSDS
jgi:argininosuccinate lyase